MECFVIDTEPLIVLLVGFFDMKNNKRHLEKINIKYNKSCYTALANYVSGKEILITPQVLAEFYSLTRRDIKSDDWEFLGTIK